MELFAAPGGPWEGLVRFSWRSKSREKVSKRGDQSVPRAARTRKLAGGTPESLCEAKVGHQWPKVLKRMSMFRSDVGSIWPRKTSPRIPPIPTPPPAWGSQPHCLVVEGLLLRDGCRTREGAKVSHDGCRRHLDASGAKREDPELGARRNASRQCGRRTYLF